MFRVGTHVQRRDGCIQTIFDKDEKRYLLFVNWIDAHGELQQETHHIPIDMTLTPVREIAFEKVKLIRAAIQLKKERKK
jgi:hypothetical protein